MNRAVVGKISGGVERVREGLVQRHEPAVPRTGVTGRGVWNRIQLRPGDSIARIDIHARRLKGEVLNGHRCGGGMTEAGCKEDDRNRSPCRNSVKFRFHTRQVGGVRLNPCSASATRN